MALVLIRLVWRNIRRRPLAALLLLIAMTTVTTTLSLALTVRATAEAPWDDTFNRTSGAHVLANSEDPKLLTALLHAPGVVVGIGPDPMVPGSAQIDGYTIPLEIVGRTTLNTQVDRPLITVGSANLGGAAIVLEQSTAAAVHAVVGDRVTIGGTALTVSGVALSVAHPPFPRSEPGLAWTSTATAQRLATALGRAVGQIELRLARPADAESFLTAHADPQVYLTSWDQTRTAALQDTATIRVILLTVSVLLGILTLGSVTVLVAGRTFEQIRQVGILKAVGLTPRAVTAMVLVEQLSTAVVATIIGVTLGPRLAGLIVQPLAGLLHTAGPAGPTLGTVSMIAGAAVGIVLIAAARPARAAARASTVNNLTTGLGHPRPTPRTAAAAAALHVPLPMSLGVRSMLRRPTRTLLGIVSYALSVALATAALATQRTLQLQNQHTATAVDDPSTALQQTADHTAAGAIQHLVTLFSVIFAVLGAINMIVIATYAARDSARNHAVLRAVGFTPTQTGTVLLTTQTATGFAATILGIPVGLALFHAVYNATNNSPAPPSNPPTAALALLLTCAVAAAALLTAAPAWLLARSPVTAALTTD